MPPSGTTSEPDEPPLLGTQFYSRHDVLAEAQVVPDASRCVQCGICSHNCPMGIDVRGHARRGRPIHDSRCLTCSECVNRCPRGVLTFERLILLGIDT
jgi:heterodisulfide reductase subunit C